MVFDQNDYYVYQEDGDLWLGFSPGGADEGVPVAYLGDVANVWDVFKKMDSHARGEGDS